MGGTFCKWGLHQSFLHLVQHILASYCLSFGSKSGSLSAISCDLSIGCFFSLLFPGFFCFFLRLGNIIGESIYLEAEVSCITACPSGGAGLIKDGTLLLSFLSIAFWSALTE